MLCSKSGMKKNTQKFNSLFFNKDYIVFDGIGADHHRIHVFKELMYQEAHLLCVEWVLIFQILNDLRITYH